jgi:hypothetical protein
MCIVTSKKHPSKKFVLTKIRGTWKIDSFQGLTGANAGNSVQKIQSATQMFQTLANDVRAGRIQSRSQFRTALRERFGELASMLGSDGSSGAHSSDDSLRLTP